MSEMQVLGGKILVVEDNLMNQNIIKKILELFKCDVTIANHGKEALEILRDPFKKNDHFDLVLMDCRMPEMDGYETTKQIRNDPYLSHISVVALTANASSEDEKHCYSVGMNGFLSKPVTKEKIFQGIKPYLTKNREK